MLDFWLTDQSIRRSGISMIQIMVVYLFRLG